MLAFKCTRTLKNRKENWSGRIISIKNYGSHIEMLIDSRSSIMVLLGNTSSGNFICIPDWKVGCHLSSIKDTFYTIEKLTKSLGPIDAITVATAIAAASNELNLK